MRPQLNISDMPFRFADVCDLLNQLEALKLRDPPLLLAQFQEQNTKTIERWFKLHRRQIDAIDTDRLAFLSTLFPERRADRVYGMQEARLSRLVARLLAFSSDRFVALQAYKTPGNGDLGACLERVIKVFDCEKHHMADAYVTVEEIDCSLHTLATRNAFSSPEVRSTPIASDPQEIHQRVLRRLKSSEAKWFVRITLKNLSPIVLDQGRIMRHVHFLLPGLLRFQDSFPAAVQLLGGPLKRYPSAPDTESARVFKQDAAQLLQPTVGVKVGRPPFFKARSIEHCMTMVGRRKWAIERKYDGEYCEIHIDLDKGSECIQIYSKSGRDSTEDRKAVHETIRQALRLHQPSCTFQRCCIVVGELVVYSGEEQSVLGFHEIRKHVKRAGRFIGTEQDCRPTADEHLMIVFFDLLLLDECNIMSKSYEQRRQILSRLVRKREGFAITSERRIVDFAKAEAKSILMKDFAFALAARTEGLVLKPADSPYFSFANTEEERKPGFYIKLKKDYMPGLGGDSDVADLAVVGGSYDPKLASRLGVRNLQFMALHVGCLVNRDEVQYRQRPVFEVVAVIHADGCVPAKELRAINDYGRFCLKPAEMDSEGILRTDSFDIRTGGSENCRIGWTFDEPCVVEVLGSGYEKPHGKTYYTLRHPRILKLHLDRSWSDASTFDELQSRANTACNVPVAGEAAEFAHMLKRLVKKAECSREAERQSQSASTTGRTKSSAQDRMNAQPTAGSPSRRRRVWGMNSPTPIVRIDTDELSQILPAGKQAVVATTLQASDNGSNTLPTPSSTPLDASDCAAFGRSPAALSMSNLCSDVENIPPSRGKRKLSVTGAAQHGKEPKRVCLDTLVGFDLSIEEYPSSQ